ncbi:MATE family efflux transporter [Selenomonas sp. AE3005]|uniref:MATE family efflux transporter n=1 Tax=Selenomonas sp. AE3005 TaxID=1485543 RepID=UPI000488E0F1|nr:MATE family efflux transporter [Selenomonas sp. AE3005]
MRLQANDRHYLGIAMPAALEGLFMVLLSSVDIIMVGVLGTAAIAAVSIFTQPRMMLLCVVRSVASVLTLLTAQKFGQKKLEEVPALLARTLFCMLILMGALHVFFFLHLERILSWMGAREDYMEAALAYGDIALVGVFMTTLATILQAVQLGYGHTKQVMSANVQGNVVNIIANALLIFGLGPFPELGVVGAAVGTVIGTSWTLIVTGYQLKNSEWSGWGSFWPNQAYFREFLPVFAGVFSEQGFERIGMVLYTRMVAELGTAAYAVHAICMNFCDFYYCFAGGLGKANMVLAGHAHGAGDWNYWQRQLRAGLKWSFVFSLLAFLLTYGLRYEIFGIYSHEAELLPLGALIMIFVAAVSFPEAHAMVCAGVLRGSGKTSQVAAYSFVSIAFLRPIITAVFLQWFHWGLAGAWLALAIDQSLRASCASFLLWRLWRNRPQIVCDS